MDGRRSVVVVAAVAAMLAGVLMTLYPDPVWIPVRAEVTRTGMMTTAGHRTQIIGLRTSTGVGEARFTDRLVNCQVGDLVDAEQAGVAIRQSATTCR